MEIHGEHNFLLHFLFGTEAFPNLFILIYFLNYMFAKNMYIRE